MNGYAGKILRLNLRDGKYSTIDTAKYKQWGGGHGMGSAIFWDLVPDKNIDGFDERNVVTIMTSPLTGTLAPGGGARTEVQGIGVQQYPIGWFTRSNFGGRFGAMLKYAGWDGVVIEGKADRPVWIDIRDGDVQIRDAKDLWGLDTWDTQKRIWKKVTGEPAYSEWTEFGDSFLDARTTQKPAVLAIGQAGENLSRIAVLIHDAGNAAGQGGFGGIWGSKNLKAISVIGTGSVHIADPGALIEARLWAKKHYTLDVDDKKITDGKYSVMGNQLVRSFSSYSSAPIPVVLWKRRRKSRPQACLGCTSGCRARNDSGKGNESSCIDTGFYTAFDLKKHGNLFTKLLLTMSARLGGEVAGVGAAMLSKTEPTAAIKATDLAQRYGINAFELMQGIPYLRDLFKMGVLGKGKAIPCDLPFDRIGDQDFVEKLLEDIAYRKGIGDDLADGFVRASKKWGRLEKDLASGLLPYPHWGTPDHYDPRFQLEWGYGSILGDRDINEHGLNLLFWMPTSTMLMGKKPFVSAEEAAKIFSEKMKPYDDDPMMLDYSEENMYSSHMAKLVAWHRHYTRFWKQSALYCDFLFPDFLNGASPDKQGMMGKAEPKFFNTVTGADLSFTDGIELGRKIWNLDNAVWILQGRHRDMVLFADYIHDIPFKGMAMLPALKNGKWKYANASGRKIDRKKFEDFKSEFYKIEGWDVASGWPKRSTLASMGMSNVADELEKNGKLGSEK